MWLFFTFFLIAQTMEQKNHLQLADSKAIAMQFQQISNYTLSQFVRISTCPALSFESESLSSKERQRLLNCESVKFILRERSAAYELPDNNGSTAWSLSKSFWNSLREAIADSQTCLFSERAFLSKKFISLLLFNVFWHFKFQAECIFRILSVKCQLDCKMKTEPLPTNSADFMVQFMQIQSNLFKIHAENSCIQHVISMERCIEIASMLLGTTNEPTFNHTEVRRLSKDTFLRFKCQSYHHYTKFEPTTEEIIIKEFTSILEPLNSKVDSKTYWSLDYSEIGPIMHFTFQILLSTSPPLYNFIHEEHWKAFLQEIGTVNEFENERFGWFCSKDSVIRIKYDLENMHLIWPSVWKAAWHQNRVTVHTLAEIGATVMEQ
jgi:hypothetical protein